MAQTIIRNGTLIDGTGGAPIPDAAVQIEGNHIKYAGPASGAFVPPGTANTIDARGGFILPGLIDTHVHLTLEGINIARDMMAPFSMRFFNAVTHARRTLDAGITSVRDAGGADAGLRQAIETGVVDGPRLQISTAILSITGGHVDGWMRSGNEFNILPPYPGMPDGRCDGIDGVRLKVREVLRAGADIVKICATGGVLSPTDHPEFTQFSPEELDVIVREAAYRNGVKVMAHAQGLEGIKNAVRAGVHSIEHGIYLDDEAIEMMLDRGTYLVPTLLAPLAVIEAGEAGGMPEYGLRKAREVMEAHSDSIGRAYQAGVRIAMGTDAGVMAHGTNLRELALMCNVGMSPMESIVATTRVAAACLGWGDRVGTVAAGKLADVIIVNSDPIKNIRTLENVDNIVMVMKDGEVYKNRM